MLKLGDGFVDLGCCGACGYLLIVQLSAQTMLLSALPCYYRHSFIYFPRTLSYPTRLHPPPTLPCQFTLIFPPPRPLPLPRHSLHCSENPAILSVAFIHCILICGSDANVLALFLLKAFQSSFDVFKYDVFAIVYIILYTSCT